jgi:lysophospholipase L1-like esterase
MKEKIRIACVGDSITFGSRVNPMETANYPMQLAALLGRGYEVKNFGVPGANIAIAGDLPYLKQEQFQKALEYQPNVIIILLGTNDAKPQNMKYLNNIEADYILLINSFAKLESKPQIWLAKPLPILENGNYGNAPYNLVSKIIPNLEKVVKNEALPLIDTYDAFMARTDIRTLYNKDNVHPNIFGARFLAQTIFTAITNKNVDRVAIIGDDIMQGESSDTGCFNNQLSYLLGVSYDVRSFVKAGSAIATGADSMALFSYSKLSEFYQAQNFCPDIVIIALGTNDTRPHNYEFIDKFADEYKLLISAFTKDRQAPRIILTTPIPVLNRGDYPVIDNERLRNGIIPKIRSIAQNMKLPLIDFYDIFIKRPDIALLYMKDDIRPNALGISAMAHAARDMILE